MKPKIHKETIKCPECKKVQKAIVEHTYPFLTYIHECKGCGLIIMESEWNTINDVLNPPENPILAHDSGT